MIMNPRWAIIGVLFAGVSHAQTATEIKACKPDALRLCSGGAVLAAMLGDRQYVFACLTREHRRELSPACDRVLKRRGY